MRGKTSGWAIMAVTLLATMGSLAQAQTQTREIIKELRVATPKVLNWQADVPPFSVEHQVRLNMEVRIDWPKLSGSNPWVRVEVNGNALTPDDLLNKTNEFVLRNGMDLMWYHSGYWRALYSPDFELAVKSKEAYAVAAKDEPYRYVWDITKYVHPGKNAVRVEARKVLPDGSTMVFRNVGIEAGKAVEPPTTKQVAPAPTGPVPTVVAKGRQPVAMAVAAGADGALSVKTGAHTVNIATRISLPGGKWHEPKRKPAKAVAGETAVSWSAGACRVERRIRVRDDHVQIADTLTNTGADLLGVMIQHQATSAAKPDKATLAGQPIVGGNGSRTLPPNPTTFVQWKDFGVGLAAEDDIFRVHIRNFIGPDGFGLADDMLGVSPGKSVTLEWSVYPTPNGDYWDFINAVRRNWDVNFEIPGGFLFNGHIYKPDKPAEYYEQWMRDRGAKIVCGGIAKYADGKYAHGTGILHAPEFVQREADWTRKMAPAKDLTPVAYFHCYACTEPNAEKLYADSRMLDAKGEHVSYPYRYRIPLYVPTRDNSYGKAIYKYVDLLIDQIGVEGVYWDEMAYSVHQFLPHAPWDGCTVRIDPNTHAVTGKTTSTTLLSQSLRKDLVEYIRGKGLFLMANTQAHTRTMSQLKNRALCGNADLLAGVLHPSGQSAGTGQPPPRGEPGRPRPPRPRPAHARRRVLRPLFLLRSAGVELHLRHVSHHAHGAGRGLRAGRGAHPHRRLGQVRLARRRGGRSVRGGRRWQPRGSTAGEARHRERQAALRDPHAQRPLRHPREGGRRIGARKI